MRNYPVIGIITSHYKDPSSNNFCNMAPVPVCLCQEQLERDGARVKIMTDHLVNVQQVKCQRMSECDSSLNLMLKASYDVPQS